MKKENIKKKQKKNFKEIKKKLLFVTLKLGRRRTKRRRRMREKRKRKRENSFHFC